MTSQLTRNYWLDVFSGWVEARDMPGPQNDEAVAVISELKSSETRAAQLQAERDELVSKLERAEARAKSNGEMWAQANRLYECASRDALDYAAKCGRMRNELERVTAERDMLKAALEINAAMR